MNLRHVELFRHIMKFGTLTQAGEIMAISQPAASKMLFQLERSTGITLFQRTKGRLKPTRDGELFFAEVQRTWESIERLERMSKDISQMRFGRLNLGVKPALAGTLMPPLIAHFRRKHENTTISLHSRSSERVIEWAIAGQIDLGITNTSTPHPNVACRVMARIPGVCIVPEQHRLAGRSDVRPEDLDGEDYVSIGAIERSTIIEKAFDAAGVRLRIMIEAPMAHLTCALVANGAGVAIVDEINARAFRGRGLVVKPFLPEISFPVWHLRPLSLSSSSLAEALTRDLEDEFERLGYRAEA
ncbi:LysR substrate-binding domain-containing protein [Bosea sp. 2YAB26]|uniref:LysR substrate-binding domain-containing protein n=2 Tax=Pseudomonadota TaxID=1224 RepID=UPI003F8E3C25